jgi:folate-binding Fe-S cluster repair protein YgfZ
VQQAIAFDKGCYTGQEVIARAHYRGRVKRRLQRFVTRTAAMLQPGDSVALDADRSGEVVDAVQLADGRCEFLAVANFGPGDAADAGASAAAAATEGAAIESLPLPYALPA